MKTVHVASRTTVVTQPGQIVRVSRVRKIRSRKRRSSLIRSSVLSWLTNAPSIEETEITNTSQPVFVPYHRKEEDPKQSQCCRIMMVILIILLILVILAAIAGIIVGVLLETKVIPSASG